MKKIIFFLAMVLLVSAAYAALPPYATFPIVYDELGISNPNFTGEFLNCVHEPDSQYKSPISALNISQYDKVNFCSWMPSSYGYGSCEDDVCHFFSIPSPRAKFAVYVEELNQVFITNELIIYADKNHLEVELFADGSATLIRTKKGYNTGLYWFIRIFFGYIFLIFILLIAAIIWYVIHKRKKAKKK